jgi:hypothetical protein
LQFHPAQNSLTRRRSCGSKGHGPDHSDCPVRWTRLRVPHGPIAFALRGLRPRAEGPYASRHPKAPALAGGEALGKHVARPQSMRRVGLAARQSDLSRNPLLLVSHAEAMPRSSYARALRGALSRTPVSDSFATLTVHASVLGLDPAVPARSAPRLGPRFHLRARWY